MPSPADWPGREIADSSGTRYGRLDDLFVGQQSGQPEFGIVTVARPGGEGTKRVAVPMHTASLAGEVVMLPLDPLRVKSAPEVQADVDAIPPDSGRRVLEYFGMSSDAAPTVPMPPVTPDAETVLSEEQLEVDTQVRAAERVRIRKQVVTEEVTVTVTLRREELVIERETIPVDSVGVASPTAFEAAEEVVVVLHAEEPVIGRRVVPVERVRLRKDLVVEQTTISEPVRKERAEIERLSIDEEPRT
jgi:uncharacterized protein (TIGR02271 family)